VRRFKKGGVKSMKEDIANIIKVLNKRETLPFTGLQRNSVYYKLISYINNSICLFISESYDDVALFIKRADEEIQMLVERNLKHTDYFTLCEQYMMLVSKHMLYQNLISIEGLNVLPEKYN
jgi:hypothetical protein